MLAKAGRQAEKQADMQPSIHTDMQAGRRASGQAGKQANMQAGRNVGQPSVLSFCFTASESCATESKSLCEVSRLSWDRRAR